MLDRLPKFIDPLLFAERGGELMGALEPAEFVRLTDILADLSGKVDIQLFFLKENKLASLTGEVTANLHLKCQNCLEAIAWQSKTSLKLGLVESIDEANLLSSEYEPLLVKNEEKISLNTLVEDELLLMIPNFPKHEHNCLNLKRSQLEDSTVLVDEKKPNNPFSVLAKLKISGDK